MIEIIKIYTKVEKLKFRIEKDLIWQNKCYVMLGRLAVIEALFHYSRQEIDFQ